eukprot:13539017-Alexandrium_andersonii.AAC.1
MAGAKVWRAEIGRHLGAGSSGLAAQESAASSFLQFPAQVAAAPGPPAALPDGLQLPRTPRSALAACRRR